MANRWAWWVAAALCAAAGIGLVAVAVLVDLDTAEKFASIGGGVIALFGFAVTLRGLLQGSGSGAPSGGSGQAAPGSSAGGGSRREVRVTAEDGGMAAADGIGAGAGGAGQWRRGRRADRERPQNETIEVTARGQGSVSSGGRIDGVDPTRRTP
ncbi:hypothetical protein ACFRMQ_13305 [Kitasatospora sp. NPDC056783]|uniref:hypothetical protein n=1 Tax=Kitasatospora sp. NPDC056783 TaxID=3345943 RepID=UPI00368FF0F0